MQDHILVLHFFIIASLISYPQFCRFEEREIFASSSTKIVDLDCGLRLRSARQIFVIFFHAVCHCEERSNHIYKIRLCVL